MRRKDREVTDLGQIEGMIRQCSCCRLGFCDGRRAYIVPLNFGYRLTDGKLRLYFHCAREGRKMDMLRENPQVCFEMDCPGQVAGGEEACSWTMYYSSVMGTGTIRTAEDEAEKIAGLTALMEHYNFPGVPQFPSKMLERTQVLILDCDEFTAKSQQKP